MKDPVQHNNAKRTDFLRSRSGCLTCRRRKVKCDENRPNCRKCQVKSRSCIWPHVSRPTGPSTGARRKSLERPSSSSAVSGDVPSSSAGTASGNIPVVDSYHSDKEAPVLPVDPPPWSSALDALGTDNSWLSQDAVDISIEDSSAPLWSLPLSQTGPGIPTKTTSGLNLSFPLNILPSLSESPLPRVYYVPPDFISKRAIAQCLVDWQSHDRGLAKSFILPQRRAEVMADSAFLAPYYPSVDDRLLVRHYLLRTAQIIMAVGGYGQSWNPWIEVLMPLTLHDLPKISPACDALRMAIIGVGAVHLRYCHAPNDNAGVRSIVQRVKTEVLRLVHSSIERQASCGSVLSLNDVEMLIGALLSCTIASSLAADDGWDELITTVAGLVEILGGPEKLLREANTWKLSPIRFFLEQLIVREVFGCMTTSKAPLLLKQDNAPWFFEAETWSSSDNEWESVERMFGVSRRLVAVMAKTCTLTSDVRERESRRPETKDHPSVDLGGFRLQLPIRVANRLGHGTQNETSEDESQLSTARDILSELDNWAAVTIATPLHPRTQYGNHMYRHALRIRILREIFHVSYMDLRVQASVSAIIELGVESRIAFGNITWLTWPILIAAFNMREKDSSRSTALLLLQAYSADACFDNVAACEMLSDFWAAESVDNLMTPAQFAVSKRRQVFWD